ncbi:MAG: acylphosphatase [Gammaproteobacteria bacterium]
MKVCRRCLVRGRVQGVFYRGAAQQKARQLGVTGWAHNLADGSVEVMACGEHQAVEVLCDWLWDGPRLAEVTDVGCERVAYRPLTDFDTR